MSCDHGICHLCEEENDKKAEQTKLMQIVSSWAWNLTPEEVAREIDDCSLDISEVIAFMRKQQYPEHAIDDVKFAWGMRSYQ
jgi:hypothetical protein